MKKTSLLILSLGLAAGLLQSASAADLSSDANYKTKCAACHGANGEGKDAMKVPSFKDSAAKPEADLVTTITKGKPPKMPAYDGKLTAEQIKQLASEIKAFK